MLEDLMIKEVENLTYLLSVISRCNGGTEKYVKYRIGKAVDIFQYLC